MVANGCWKWKCTDGLYETEKWQEGTVVLFFPFLSVVFTCSQRLPVLIATPACLPLLQCDCLFLESCHVSQHMAQSWHGHGAQEAVWLQTWRMSLELICPLSLKRSLMQSASVQQSSGQDEPNDALWHYANICKHVSQAKDKSIQIPQDYSITCKTLRFCVGLLVASDAAILNQLQPIVDEVLTEGSHYNLDWTVPLFYW